MEYINLTDPKFTEYWLKRLYQEANSRQNTPATRRKYQEKINRLQTMKGSK